MLMIEQLGGLPVGFCKSTHTGARDVLLFSKPHMSDGSTKGSSILIYTTSHESLIRTENGQLLTGEHCSTAAANFPHAVQKIVEFHARYDTGNRGHFQQFFNLTLT